MLEGSSLIGIRAMPFPRDGLTLSLYFNAIILGYGTVLRLGA